MGKIYLQLFINIKIKNTIIKYSDINKTFYLLKIHCTYYVKKNIRSEQPNLTQTILKNLKNTVHRNCISTKKNVYVINVLNKQNKILYKLQNTD